MLFIFGQQQLTGSITDNQSTGMVIGYIILILTVGALGGWIVSQIRKDHQDSKQPGDSEQPEA